MLSVCPFMLYFSRVSKFCSLSGIACIWPSLMSKEQNPSLLMHLVQWISPYAQTMYIEHSLRTEHIHSVIALGRSLRSSNSGLLWAPAWSGEASQPASRPCFSACAQVSIQSTCCTHSLDSNSDRFLVGLPARVRCGVLIRGNIAIQFSVSSAASPM